MLEGYDITLRRALRLIGLSSSMYYYKPKRDDSEALKLMSDYAEENPTHGQDMMVKVFHKSHGWNHKKTVRLYHKLRLPVVRKRRFRRLVEPVEPLVQPIVENETWSMDFMSDSLMGGGKVRVLNVIEDYNREYLGYDVARSLPAERVIRTLDDLIDFYGKPRRIRIDNGPEYRSDALTLWAQKQKIKLLFIEPGKPTQNSYIERFNRTYRTEVLNAYLFESIEQMWDETENFQYKYNNLRPHGSLMDMAPIEFKEYRKSLPQRPLRKGLTAKNLKLEFN